MNKYIHLNNKNEEILIKVKDIIFIVKSKEDPKVIINFKNTEKVLENNFENIKDSNKFFDNIKEIILKQEKE